MDGMLGRAPVVLVELSFSFEGEGRAEFQGVTPCESARFHRDEPRVELFRAEDSPRRVGFVALHVADESWRAHAFPPERPGFTLFGGGASGGGGAGFGHSGLFRGGPDELYAIRWDGERAFLDERPLAKGETLRRDLTYRVPSDAGGFLTVTEHVRVTYLGKLPVTVSPPPPCLLT